MPPPEVNIPTRGTGLAVCEVAMLGAPAKAQRIDKNFLRRMVSAIITIRSNLASFILFTGFHDEIVTLKVRPVQTLEAITVSYLISAHCPCRKIIDRRPCLVCPGAEVEAEAAALLAVSPNPNLAEQVARWRAVSRPLRLAVHLFPRKQSSPGRDRQRHVSEHKFRLTLRPGFIEGSAAPQRR